MTQYAIHEGMMYHFQGCKIVKIVSTKGDWVTYKDISIDLDGNIREDQSSNGTRRAKLGNFYGYTDSFELIKLYKKSLREIGNIIWETTKEMNIELNKLARSL